MNRNRCEPELVVNRTGCEPDADLRTAVNISKLRPFETRIRRFCMSRRELSDFDAVTRSCFGFQWVLVAFWSSKKCSFEVDDPPEARTWEIDVFERF